ncbi:MAG: alpha/beta hydrolase-fold protein [Acidobacteriota bacterium]
MSHKRESFFLAARRVWLGVGRSAPGVLLAALVVQAAPAAQQPVPAKGTLERLTVHGRALEGNLEGDSPDRPVVVYLPPSYVTDTSRRYPVLYFLHGYTATAEAYVKSLAIPDAIDRAVAAGAGEMIVVIPDAFSKYGGSMFSNSPTIGDWETFIAQDLTTFIDRRYRTIASREGRGLAGHSMGGYGTMRIGMKQPSAFAALYAMSSCCLMNDPGARGAGPGPRGDAAARGTGGGAGAGRGDGRGAGAARGGGMANALSAQAAAWAPNTKTAPFFDLPTKDGEIQPLIAAKWIANSPLVMVDQYVPALKSMRAIALDVGNQDPFVGTNTQLAASIKRLDVAHTFEVYDGDHGNRIRERFESQVLRFFSQHLSAR